MTPGSPRESCVPRLGLGFRICKRLLGGADRGSIFLLGVELNQKPQGGQMGKSAMGALCSGSHRCRPCGPPCSSAGGSRPSSPCSWGQAQRGPVTAPGVGSGSAPRPQEHSHRLGTWVLVAAPADRLGPLAVVAQVPLYHVVVSAAPAAIFGELDTCGGAGCHGPRPARAPLPHPGPQG